jgi:hypothetical protein
MKRREMTVTDQCRKSDKFEIRMALHEIRLSALVKKLFIDK